MSYRHRYVDGEYMVWDEVSRTEGGGEVVCVRRRVRSKISTYGNT